MATTPPGGPAIHTHAAHRAYLRVGLMGIILALPALADDPPKTIDANGVTITVSEQTTGITGPFKPDGSLDYIAAVNARFSQGVTPDNNAMALMVRMYDLNQLLADGTRDRFLQALGVGDLPEDRPIFKQWDGEADVLDRCTRQPWTDKDHPAFAKWLDANAAAMDVLPQAAARPKFWAPLIAKNEAETLLSAELLRYVIIRESANALIARAQRHVEAGRFNEATADWQAAREIGRKIATGPTLVDNLVGLSIARFVDEAVRAAALSSRLTAAQLGVVERTWRKLPPLSDPAGCIWFERLTQAESAICLASGKPIDLGEGGTIIFGQRYRKQVDWDAALIDIQLFHGAAAQMARLRPTMTEQHDAINAFRRVVETRGARAMRQKALGQAMEPDFAVDDPELPKKATLWVADMVNCLFMPRVGNVSQIHHAYCQNVDLTLLVLALQIYRDQQGAYPDSLDDLVPGYIKTVPIDRGSGKPLIYRTSGKGFLLYSVGKNGIDDNAVTQQHAPESSNADDIVVRHNWPVE